MITEQRLKELIKQGATIWSSRFNKADKIKLYQDYDICKNQLCTYNKNHTFLDGRIRLNKLHESKEQAQWHIDNTFERVERLELPTFEEFCKHPYLSFCDEFTDLYELEIDGDANIVLTLYRGGICIYGSIKFSKELTEENYNQARQLCKKLFLGEEV